MVCLPKGRTASTRLDGAPAYSLTQVRLDLTDGSARSAIESLFRSLNNLLERFHQSFFLYLMTSVDSFVAVGNYLAAPILLGAGLTIQGLMTWAEAAAGAQGARPLKRAVGVLGAAAAAGAAQLRLVEAVDPTMSIHVRLQSFPLAARTDVR